MILETLIAASAAFPLSASHTNDYDCLVAAIYFEAGNQSFAGKLAVSNVILNRVYSEKFPSTYCGVIKQHKQFSYLNKGLPDTLEIKDLDQWLEAIEVASRSYYRDDLDITNGSLFYHADYVSPAWDFTKLEKVVTIDNHIFYKEVK